MLSSFSYHLNYTTPYILIIKSFKASFTIVTITTPKNSMCVHQNESSAIGQLQSNGNNMGSSETKHMTSYRIMNELSDMNNKSGLQLTKDTATTTLLAAVILTFLSFVGVRLLSFDGVNSGQITSLITVIVEFIENFSNTAFYQAFSLVFISEIGDKTFFIACLVAMKAGRVVSFVGTFSALAVLTVLSVLIGQLFHSAPAGFVKGLPIRDVFAILAFTFFGLKTLKEAYESGDGDSSGIEEEYADAEEAVQGSRTIRQVTAWGKIVSTFGLVFVAEFGDRSFISTIVLGAANTPVSMALGAVSGHALATCIAVLGGSYIAKHLSEKAIRSFGGCLFLAFAINTSLRLF